MSRPKQTLNSSTYISTTCNVSAIDSLNAPSRVCLQTVSGNTHTYTCNSTKLTHRKSLRKVKERGSKEVLNEGRRGVKEERMEENRKRK